MRAQLLHLSGPCRGHTITYEGTAVRIGSAPDNDAVLRDANVAAHHAAIEFVEDECQFHLHARDGQTFVNGNEVEEVILQDGDRLEFGAGGPMVRFRVYVPAGAVCKPVRTMLADARDVARASGGAVATRTLTRDLLTQATLQLKIGVPVVIVASAFLAGWLGGFLGSRPVDETEFVRTADAVTHEQIDALRAEMEAQHEALLELARANAVVSRIQREWSRGVCLVHGVFRLRREEQWVLAASGDPIEYEYTGSGFLARSSGQVVTNRHIVEPWFDVPSARRAIETGAEPFFTRLTATFPGKRPVHVSTERIRRSEVADVAVFELDPGLIEGVPVLPLREGPLDSDDQTAIVVGYPAGLAALMARADEALVEDLRRRSASLADAIDELAAADQVRPLMTRGIVSEVRGDRIVYDAPTTHGGSGGPVFGGDGTVIAVNYAILPAFGGANFGLSVRFAQELLP